jgi:hypothetical protein
MEIHGVCHSFSLQFDMLRIPNLLSQGIQPYLKGIFLVGLFRTPRFVWSFCLLLSLSSPLSLLRSAVVTQLKQLFKNYIILLLPTYLIQKAP